MPIMTAQELQHPTQPDLHEFTDFKAFKTGDTIDKIAYTRGVIRNTVQGYVINNLLYGRVISPSKLEEFHAEMDIDGYRNDAYRHAMVRVRENMANMGAIPAILSSQ